MKITKIQLTIVALVLCAALAVGLILHMDSQSKSGHVTIKGFSSCSNNINPVITNDVSTKLYALVKSANDYNKSSTSSSYNATIRSGTCKQSDTVYINDTQDKKRAVQATTITVDIPKAKQSWILKYDWVTKNESFDGIDLGTIQPSCLSVDQLPYGDFKCENILGLAKYGTDKVDPILQYMPYTGAGFRLEYNPDDKTVFVVILPPDGEQDVAAFTENTKAVIPYWFQKRNLDQTKYRVIYSTDNVDD